MKWKMHTNKQTHERKRCKKKWNEIYGKMWFQFLGWRRRRQRRQAVQSIKLAGFSDVENVIVWIRCCCRTISFLRIFFPYTFFYHAVIMYCHCRCSSFSSSSSYFFHSFRFLFCLFQTENLSAREKNWKSWRRRRKKLSACIQRFSKNWILWCVCVFELKRVTVCCPTYKLDSLGCMHKHISPWCDDKNLWLESQRVCFGRVYFTHIGSGL